MRSHYSESELETLHARRAVEEWRRSDVISGEERDRLMNTLPVDLRCTRFILRLVLFGATALLIIALHFWVGERLVSLLDDIPLLVLATLAYGITADLAVRRYRLFRHGIEEMLGLAASAYFGLALARASGEFDLGIRLAGWINDPSDTLAFFGAGVAAAIVAWRFESVVAAVAAQLLFLGAILFSSSLESGIAVSLVFGLVCMACLIQARSYLNKYKEGIYRILASTSLCGVYLGLSLEAMKRNSAVNAMLGLMVLTGGFGLYWGIRNRDRLLLNVGGGLTLLTIVTAKAYLGLPYQTWGGIELGAGLIALAVLLRRWIASGPGGERNGFTAKRLLSRDELVFTAATFAAPAVVSELPSPKASSEPPSPALGGGRSGGAGATGDF